MKCWCKREHSVEDLSCFVLVAGACYFIQIFWWFTPCVLSSVHFRSCLAATNSYEPSLLLFLCIPCVYMLFRLWSSKTAMKKIVVMFWKLLHIEYRSEGFIIFLTLCFISSFKFFWNVVWDVCVGWWSLEIRRWYIQRKCPVNNSYKLAWPFLDVHWSSWWLLPLGECITGFLSKCRSCVNLYPLYVFSEEGLPYVNWSYLCSHSFEFFAVWTLPSVLWWGSLTLCNGQVLHFLPSCDYVENLGALGDFDKIWAHPLSADRAVKSIHHFSDVGTHHWYYDKWGWNFAELL